MLDINRIGWFIFCYLINNLFNKLKIIAILCDLQRILIDVDYWMRIVGNMVIFLISDRSISFRKEIIDISYSPRFLRFQYYLSHLLHVLTIIWICHHTHDLCDFQLVLLLYRQQMHFITLLLIFSWYTHKFSWWFYCHTVADQHWNSLFHILHHLGRIGRVSCKHYYVVLFHHLCAFLIPRLKNCTNTDSKIKE